MEISVFGLGYVGTVTAACLARAGHRVVGVDTNAEKVDLLGRGRSPILEPGLEDIVREMVTAGRLRATTNSREAVEATSVTLIAVGTPVGEHGDPDLSHVYRVCEDIGRSLSNAGDHGKKHIVVIRSTTPPHAVERCEALLREQAGSSSVSVVVNPEFLREGSAIADFYAPPYTIVGTTDAQAAETLADLYATVAGPLLVVTPRVAGLVKYGANAWHATKIAFANEIGRLAKSFGVDGRQVMDILARDTKLNTSAAYLRPGFAYGGSCLPKDLEALLHFARGRNLSLPLLSAVPASNGLLVEAATEEVIRSGAKRVAVLGLAFKAGTDDLRESPVVLLVKRLLGEGCSVRICDPIVCRAQLIGMNLSYIRQHLPHFEAMLTDDPEAAIADAELVIVAHALPEYAQLLTRDCVPIRVLDLVGLFATRPNDMDYTALSW